MAAQAPAMARLPAVEENAAPAPTGREGLEAEARWKPVLGLRCDLTVDLPIPDFKISDFLQLRSGSVVAAHWRVGQDVPLRVNGTTIGWIEFEEVGGKLAVRLTELA